MFHQVIAKLAGLRFLICPCSVFFPSLKPNVFIIDSFCAFYAEYSADSLDDLLGSVHKLQGRLSVSAVKCKLAMP